MWNLPVSMPAQDLIGLLVLAGVAIWAAVAIAMRGEARGRRRSRPRRLPVLLMAWLAPIVLIALVVRGAWRSAAVLALALAVYVGVLRWRAGRSTSR